VQPMKTVLRAARSRTRVYQAALARQFVPRREVDGAYREALRQAARTVGVVTIDGKLAGRFFPLLVELEISRSGGRASVPEAARAVAARLRSGAPVYVAWDRLVAAQVNDLPAELQPGVKALLPRLLGRGRGPVDAFLERLRLACELPAGEGAGTLQGLLSWSRSLEADSLRLLEDAMRTVAEGKAGQSAGRQALAHYMAVRDVRELGLGKALAYAGSQGPRDLAGVMLHATKARLEYAAEQVSRSQVVKTRRGVSVARPGDWLLKGLEGETWSVSDQAFRRLYDPVPGKPGIYAAKARTLRTWQLSVPTDVSSRFGTHAGKPGDWVMSETGADGKRVRWVVERSIVGKAWNLASH